MSDTCMTLSVQRCLFAVNTLLVVSTTACLVPSDKNNIFPKSGLFTFLAASDKTLCVCVSHWTRVCVCACVWGVCDRARAHEVALVGMSEYMYLSDFAGH